MEQQIINSFTSLGVVGIIAGVLFKKFLDDSKNDKEYFRAELKESREVFQDELRQLREESQKDREVYIESIEKVTERISNIEDEVKDIKETLKREG